MQLWLRFLNRMQVYTSGTEFRFERFESIQGEKKGKIFKEIPTPPRLITINSNWVKRRTKFNPRVFPQHTTRVFTSEVETCTQINSCYRVLHYLKQKERLTNLTLSLTNYAICTPKRRCFIFLHVNLYKKQGLCLFHTLKKLCKNNSSKICDYFT